MALLFLFSELDPIFQLFHLYSSVAKSPINLCPKIQLIWSQSESVISHEIREGPKSNATNVSI